MADPNDKASPRSANKILATGKEFKNKLAAEGGVSADDLGGAVHSLAWAEILRMLFSSGVKDDPVESAVRDAFLTWAEQERLDDLDDLLIVKEDGSPLTGSLAEARVVAAKLVRDTEFRHKPLAGLLLYTLAPTLRRWETLQTATPEDIGDFLLPALGASDAPRPQPTRALTDFGVRLWRLMQTQIDWDIGYWQTVRALGDFFVRAKGRETLALVATIYHALIQAQTKDVEDAEAADLVRGAANNLSSLFDDLAGKAPSGKVAAAIAAAGRLHVLAADAIEDRGRKPRAERWALALDELGNTPSAFQQVGDDSLRLRHLRQAWFSARTGVVRARLRKPGEADAKDVASAFFNAGVAILRAGNRRSPPFATARIVVNALGLWWALHLSAVADEKALGPYNGGNCAVNLMGALTDLDPPKLDRLRTASLPGLWAGLFVTREAIGAADFQRIAKSAEEMKLPEQPMGNDVLLKAAVSAFLVQFADLLALPWLARVVAAKDSQRAAYQSWWAAASALCPLTTSNGGVTRLCRPVWHALNRVPPHLDELPEAIAGDWLAFLDGRHPLVAAGLMTQDEISALMERGEGAPISLGDWMAKNAWSLAGAIAVR